jgi:CBS domain-containing protein
MTTVKQLLGVKGDHVDSIAADATVYEALARMALHNIGALLVMEENRLTGLISERDYARKVVLQGRSSRDTRVGDIMTGNPICVAPDTEVMMCMALMIEKRVRHLPVLIGERVVGIVSIGDVLKQVITEQDYTIHQLEDYIRAG